MNTKVEDVMVSNVVVAQPHHTAEHVAKMLQNNNIRVVPVTNADGEPVGVISSMDLLRGDHKPGTPVKKFMTDKVYTVAKYDGTHIAARVMRNHKIHHVVVTHEKKIAGIVSAFDLLKLVEDHRFTMKNPPSTSNGKQ